MTLIEPYRPSSGLPVASWEIFKAFLIEQREGHRNRFVVSVSSALSQHELGNELTHFHELKVNGPCILYGWRLEDVVTSPAGTMALELSRYPRDKPAKSIEPITSFGEFARVFGEEMGRQAQEMAEQAALRFFRTHEVHEGDWGDPATTGPLGVVRVQEGVEGKDG